MLLTACLLSLLRCRCTSNLCLVAGARRTFPALAHEKQVAAAASSSHTITCLALTHAAILLLAPLLARSLARFPEQLLFPQFSSSSS
ncbi:hypothetical protein GW17_00043433 [Ensete ventricosum]|nr:hypothetical protein GW17_00043433 [Ensete ventricosum]